MAEPARHHRLRPWLIGLVSIVIGDVITGYVFFAHVAAGANLSPGMDILLLMMVYVLLPVIYLTLMYMALKSQS